MLYIAVKLKNMKTHKYLVKEPHLKEVLGLLNNIKQILMEQHDPLKHGDLMPEICQVSEIIDQLK